MLKPHFSQPGLLYNLSKVSDSLKNHRIIQDFVWYTHDGSMYIGIFTYIDPIKISHSWIGNYTNVPWILWAPVGCDSERP